MAVQVGETLPTAPTGPPLVVVVSPRTAEVLREIVAAGWSGPVLVVGTVHEAQQVVESQPVETQPTQDRPRPEPVRRAAPYPQQPQATTLGLELDPHRQLLVCGHHECALTPLEFGVLEALAEHPGEVRRFADLTRRVWGSAHVGDGGQVHAVIGRVRRKLDLVHAPVDLLAVRGVGFRLVAREGAGQPRLVVAD